MGINNANTALLKIVRKCNDDIWHSLLSSNHLQWEKTANNNKSIYEEPKIHHSSTILEVFPSGEGQLAGLLVWRQTMGFHSPQWKPCMPWTLYHTCKFEPDRKSKRGKNVEFNWHPKEHIQAPVWERMSQVVTFWNAIKHWRKLISRCFKGRRYFFVALAITKFC